MEEVGFLRWLGHGSLLFVSPAGTTLLVDPWLEDNPSTPDEFRKVERADAILVTHGHYDHIADVVSNASRLEAPAISTTEVVAYLASQGATETIEMNKSGSVTVDDVTVTMVAADHSSGCPGADGEPNIEGGSAVGFVLRGPGFRPVYIAGDTGVFGDMRLIGELYRPELAALPIDGHFNMGPREAAKAVELLAADRVFPYHWGTYPVLAGRPDALADELKRAGSRAEVIETTPGAMTPLGKE